MRQCNCGSFAINPHQHGRDETDLNLCDVCYWRKRADAIQLKEETKRVISIEETKQLQYQYKIDSLRATGNVEAGEATSTDQDR